MQDLTDFAHRLVGILQRPHQLVGGEGQAALAQTGIGGGADPAGGVEDRIDCFVPCLGLHRRGTSCGPARAVTG